MDPLSAALAEIETNGDEKDVKLVEKEEEDKPKPKALALQEHDCLSNNPTRIIPTYGVSSSNV